MIYCFFYMKLDINIIKDAPSEKDKLTEREIKEILNICLELANKKYESILLNVTFCNRETMLDLNRSTRNEHHATNVLSFSPKEGCINNLVKNNFIKSDQVDSYFGDIVFCIDVVKEESEKLKIPIKERYYMLLSHSIYHLLGYEHKTKEEEDIINDLIMRTLLHFGIKDPYLYNCYDATDVD